MPSKKQSIAGLRMQQIKAQTQYTFHLVAMTLQGDTLKVLLFENVSISLGHAQFIGSGSHGCTGSALLMQLLSRSSISAHPLRDMRQ
jgi:hypothetical protein